MTNSHIASQALHVMLLEHVTHQTVGFAHLRLLPVRGDHSSRILAPVLQHRQRVIEFLVDRPATDQTNYSAHSPSQLLAKSRHCVSGLTQQADHVLFESQ